MANLWQKNLKNGTIYLAILIFHLKMVICGNIDFIVFSNFYFLQTFNFFSFTIKTTSV